MKKIRSAVVAVLAVTGCAPALIPGAEKVVFTKNPDDIVACKVIGKTAWNPESSLRAGIQFSSFIHPLRRTG